MKVQITFMKAPWPLGAVVGDVVDVGEVMPAWALGKCVEVAEDAPVFVVNPAQEEAPAEVPEPVDADVAKVAAPRRGRPPKTEA